MLSEKTGTKMITGKRVAGSNPRQQQQQQRNYQSAKNNNSFMSTNYSRGNRQDNLDDNAEFAQNIDHEAVKSQIIDGAWRDPRLASSLNDYERRRNTCCEADHLPHNEMNPQCYRNASGITSRIPFAGWQWLLSPLLKIINIQL